jgi:ectoine hydroxylase-related dioxygenase (phytanoyl-CoA dioxygenase family)
MLHEKLNLPDLSESYTVTKEQIKEYKEKGHVHLPNVCSGDEVTEYRNVIRETAYENFKQDKSLDERDTYGKAFLQTLNMRFKSKGVQKFTLAKRFASIAYQLLEDQSVRIYHEQALFKEPGGGHSPLHQDQYYWPLATNQSMGMWMPLVDVTLEMGPILFATGSHKKGFLGQHQISDHSQDNFEKVIKDENFPIWQQGMKAGDATFHNGWTIHGATANKSDKVREAMVVTYYPDGTKVDELTNDNRIGDAKNFLGGKQTGELADSGLNTVVYP